MADHLLPSNATAFERAFSLATDESARLDPGIVAMRTAKRTLIPDSFLPFLIYEYGLGEVSAFVRDQRELLRTGIDWQRVRGTPYALTLALRWLEYAATLDQADVARARWNLFQLALSRIPPDADLERIEAVAGLSVPVRSHFWRGYRGYDVREMVWSRKRWGGAAWSSSSGVRVRDGGAKWSFGRTRDFEVPMDQPTLEALGAWVPLAGASLEWGNFTWEAVGATWVGADVQDRINAIISALTGRRVYVVLRDASGAVIGYRRARAVHPVIPVLRGRYSVGNVSLEIERAAPAGLYVEAMTGFGDGAGQSVASVSLAWDAEPYDFATPGLLWVPPNDMLPGVEVVPQPVDIELNRTTRERFRFLLTF